MTTNSESYTLPNDDTSLHYYLVFEVTVPVDGDYILESKSRLDIGDYTVLAYGLNEVNLLQINSSVIVPTTTTTAGRLIILNFFYNDYN